MLGLDKSSAPYKQHRQQVHRDLEKATDELEAIVKMKDDIVKSRLSQQRDLQEVHKEAVKFVEREA